MAIQSLCSVPGCDKPAKSLGYCNTHYLRFHRLGDPLAPVAPYQRRGPVCTIDGCEDAHYARGYCHKHYQRWRATGNPIPRTRQPLRCSVENCDGKHVGLGYCGNHYRRFKRYGDPLGGPPSPRPRGTALEWLLSHKNYRGRGCLIWPFLRTESGYTIIDYNRKQTSASRAMCIEVYGPPPTPQHEAAHTCGKGHEGCVHPLHLRWATSSENEEDKKIHGTDNRGERHPMVKLTVGDVIAIRSMKGNLPLKEVARIFGVSESNVCGIQNRRFWRWLP